MDGRTATASDLEPVADTLAGAFFDDPVWAWAFPDPGAAARAARRAVGAPPRGEHRLRLGLDDGRPRGGHAVDPARPAGAARRPGRAARAAPRRAPGRSRPSSSSRSSSSSTPPTPGTSRTSTFRTAAPSSPGCGATRVERPVPGPRVTQQAMTSAPLPLRMPAETDPHERTLMAWPCRTELWGPQLAAARADYATVADAIARFEPVTMIASPADAEGAAAACGSGVTVLELPLDDSWVRDNGPIVTFDADGGRVALDFSFNAWGEKFLPYDDDALLVARWAAATGMTRRPVPLVLEGGSIAVDGAGTLVTTEQCLLHLNRNPGRSRTGDRAGAARRTGRHHHHLAATRAGRRRRHRRPRRQRGGVRPTGRDPRAGLRRPGRARPGPPLDEPLGPGRGARRQRRAPRGRRRGRAAVRRGRRPPRRRPLPQPLRRQRLRGGAHVRPSGRRRDAGHHRLGATPAARSWPCRARSSPTAGAGRTASPSRCPPSPADPRDAVARSGP